MVLTCKKTLATLHILDIPPTDNIWLSKMEIQTRKSLFSISLALTQNFSGELNFFKAWFRCDESFLSCDSFWVQQIPVDGPRWGNNTQIWFRMWCIPLDRKTMKKSMEFSFAASVTPIHQIFYVAWMYDFVPVIFGEVPFRMGPPSYKLVYKPI